MRDIIILLACLAILLICVIYLLWYQEQRQVKQLEAQMDKCLESARELKQNLEQQLINRLLDP